YLDDLAHFNESEFRKIVESQCFLLSIFGPTFWEDTDRGNMNIYFAPEKNQIQLFKDMVGDQIKRRLIKLEADTQYLSMEVESLLNKRHTQDGFLNDTEKERLEELQHMISLRKTRQIEEGEWTAENDLLFTLVSIAFSDRDIDESEKEAIRNSFKSILPDVSEDKFDTVFITTAQKYIKLQTPEAQIKQYEISLLELVTYFDNDESKLQNVLAKFIELANADNFIHENEVKLIKQAVAVWKLEGDVQQNEKERLVYLKTNK
ncbi:MAG: TerB family tellurite resistance protein, partial [SAR324 cluster bacterium]|nr:TerB family tellurite resistance protein [SAR324 cluster bacterium]